MAILSKILHLYFLVFPFTVIPLALIMDIDQEAISAFSTDFGRIVTSRPVGLLQPSSLADIVNLIRLSYTSGKPFTIGARGLGHSSHGQSLVGNGVVVNMSALRVAGDRITVYPQNFYVDAGGEQLWVDVLNATLVHGLAPRSWTDYLYLTIGGTLSNAGMGGQAFRFGPLISNVYEMDVITGKGELMTCSRNQNSDLFYAVLGGLGQFGVITRARIALEAAPKRVKFCEFEYDDFTPFTAEQEYQISLKNGFESIEGMVFVSNRTSAIAYNLLAAKYYNEPHEVNYKDLIGRLSNKPASIRIYDFSYFDFLNRYMKFIAPTWRSDDRYPWLHLFVPASRIADFDSGVFRGIAKDDLTPTILVYPTYRSMWDEKMSAVVPEESVFYSVFLVRSSATEWERLEQQNRMILKFLSSAGIKYKQYLAFFNSTADWKQHFGSKWSGFEKGKKEFDPLKILSTPRMYEAYKYINERFVIF